MMNRKPFRNWMIFTQIALAGCTLAVASQAQEPVAKDAQAMIAKTLSQVAHSQLTVDPPYFNPSILRGDLVIAQKYLASYQQYSKELSELIQKMSQESKAQLAVMAFQFNRTDEEATVETGMPIASEETVEMLTRNCMLELQRLDWEQNVEKATAENNTTEESNSAESLRLQSQALVLQGLQIKLNAARESLAETSQKVKKGILPQADLKAVELSVSAIENEFAVSQKNLEVSKAELSLRRQEAKTATATRIKEMSIRRDNITKQLERLKLQRQWARQEAEIKANRDAVLARMQAIEKLQFENLSKQLEHQVLGSMVDNAIETLNKAKDPK